MITVEEARSYCVLDPKVSARVSDEIREAAMKGEEQVAIVFSREYDRVVAVRQLEANGFTVTLLSHLSAAVIWSIKK